MKEEEDRLTQLGSTSNTKAQNYEILQQLLRN